MGLIETQKIFPGIAGSSYNTLHKKAVAGRFIDNILDHNPSVFNKHGKEQLESITGRMGWTDIAHKMMDEIPRIEKLVNQVRDLGTEHIVILGMGGSSLAPEVFAKAFGKLSWLKSIQVIDTTAPTTIDSFLSTVDITKCFFIVSSKSGKTIETASLFRTLFRIVKDIRPLKAGSYFAAITDERSDIHHIGRRNRFRDIYLNPSDIGGRYSALSFFGIVPAAFTRMNLGKFLREADDFFGILDSNPNDNDALSLGCFLGSAYHVGRDKLCFAASKKTSVLVPWIEQLVAESTGKEGKGIIPVANDYRGPATDYNNKSAFIYYTLGSEKPIAKPSAAGNKPYAVINIPKVNSVGAEMLKWEMATAVASIALGVNPFDEPNVAESKANTSKFLKTRRGPRKEIHIDPLFHYGEMDIFAYEGIKAFARSKPVSPEDTLKGLFAGSNNGGYVSLLCYSEKTPAIEKKLNEIRQLLSDKYKITALYSFGPQYLHSLGQLHKGGPQNGRFIIFEREYTNDFNIPTTLFSFKRLIKAQAKGDIAALAKRKRPVVIINMKQNPEAALAGFLELVKR